MVALAGQDKVQGTVRVPRGAHLYIKGWLPSHINVAVTANEMRVGLSVSVCRHWHQTLCKPLQSEKRVRGQVPESAAVLVLQRTALHDKPVGLSLDKVVHVQRGHFTFLIAYLHDFLSFMVAKLLVAIGTASLHGYRTYCCVPPRYGQSPLKMNRNQRGNALSPLQVRTSCGP